MMPMDFSKLFDTEFSKHLPKFSGFPFDTATLLESQRKNVQAFAEIQKKALEGLQAAAQKQGELVSQMAQDNSALAHEIMNEGTPEQKIARQTDIAKKVYEKSISGMKEIGEILTKSNQGVTDIINKRVSATLTEVKTAIEKGGKPSSVKKAA